MTLGGAAQLAAAHCTNGPHSGAVEEPIIQCLLTSLHSVDPNCFNSDSYVHSSGHSLRKLPRHWFRFMFCRLDYCNSLLYGVTENVMRRVQSLQSAAARLITGAKRRHHITPVLCQLQWLFGGEWSSNSPVWWCARHCAVKCLRTWLLISISSPKATDDPFGLPLITCVRCHVRTTASETEALALPVREFGTVCHAACEHLTSATNILKHYWRRICLTRSRRFVTFYINALEILLLTYFYLQSAAITDPPMPQPAALRPSPRNVLRQRILIATHFPTPEGWKTELAWAPWV